MVISSHQNDFISLKLFHLIKMISSHQNDFISSK